MGPLAALLMAIFIFAFAVMPSGGHHQRYGYEKLRGQAVFQAAFLR